LLQERDRAFLEALHGALLRAAVLRGVPEDADALAGELERALGDLLQAAAEAVGEACLGAVPQALDDVAGRGEDALHLVDDGLTGVDYLLHHFLAGVDDLLHDLLAGVDDLV